MKSEKGLISLYVLFGMLFLLVFVLSMYIGIRNNLQLEEYKTLEVEEIYSKNIDVVADIDVAENDELIPIYNVDQFDIVCTGNYIKINNKIYQCGIGMSYVLRNNIIVDIDEDLKYKKNGFNDFKLYNSTYYIDKLNNQIYYYKDGCYWICLVHQKFNENNGEFVNKQIYTQNEFSIIGDYYLNDKRQYMIIWNDEEGNFGNIDVKNQVSSFEKILSINQIEVFKKNYKNIDKKNGEYFLFVNIGNSI